MMNKQTLESQSRKHFFVDLPLFGKTLIAFNFTALLIFAAVIFSATVNTYAVCTTPQFGLPIVLNVTRPVAAATGDFNRDGNIDIAVLKNDTSLPNPGTVELFLGNGNSSFTSTGVQYNATSFTPADLAAADFNNDGRLDLAASSGTSNGRIAILLGNGSGGFNTPSSFPASDSNSIAVGDFNNDGNTDVIVNKDGATFNYYASLLPGLGNGNLGAAINIPTDRNGYTVKVRDFNNDGFLDFVTVNGFFNANVSVRLGNGSFIFTNPPQPTSISSAVDSTINDFNRDGKPDILVAREFNTGSTNSAAMLLGVGDGTFTTPADSLVALPNTPRSVTSADFNSDNIPDAAFGNTSATNSLSILLNNGTGGFGSAFNLSPETGASLRVYPVDFNANGATDLVIVKEITQNKVVVLPNLCTPASRNNFPDFDADGRADLSVFRPSNGTWYVNRSTQGNTQAQFGIATDKLIPADYDGDGRTDIAVYRTADGIWYILNSTTNTVRALLYGFPTDIPVPGDYDGDGKADFAVFRPSTGTWFILGSINNNFSITQFGLSGDIPIIGNFDTDTKTDIAVFRPSNGTWYILRSALGFTATQWGTAGDIPVAADYDGDGKTDFGVFRNGNWFLLRSQLGFQSFGWGTTGDIPTPADYDGDGKTDFAVFRNGTWYLSRSTAGVQVTGFGVTGDKPIPASYQP